MTATRRLLLLAGLLLAVVLGTGIPADAAFAASTAPLSTTITATVVAPPTNVVGALACAKTSTMSVTWTTSTSPRVAHYLVSVYFSDGFVQTAQVAGTATSWSATITEYNVTAYSIAYTVTTQTDYGWSTESTRTGTFQC